MAEWRAIVRTEVRREYYVYADDYDAARDAASDAAAEDCGYTDVVDTDIEDIVEVNASTR